MALPMDTHARLQEVENRGANEAVCPPWYWKSAAVWPEPFHEEVGGEYVKETLGVRSSLECEVLESRTHARAPDVGLYTIFTLERSCHRTYIYIFRLHLPTYLSTYVRAYIQAYMHTCIHTRTHTQAYIHTYTHTHAYSIYT